MKYAQKVIFLIAVATLMMGCKVDSVPDCIFGAKRCEDNPVLNSGILSICIENNTWQQMACTAGCISKTECGNENMPGCNTEGEQFCESMDALSMSFICINREWIPMVCASDATCDGNVCSASQTECEDGAQLCTYSETLKSSISAVCLDGQWVASYCQSGLGCDGNVCATEQSTHACGNPSVNCEKTAGWKSGSCEAGQCVATECKKLYDLKDGKCETVTDRDCPLGSRLCGSTLCVNMHFDPYNCGECDRECNENEVCDEGECVEIEPTCGNGEFYTFWDEEKNNEAFCINSELLLKNLKASLQSDDYEAGCPRGFPKGKNNKSYILMNDIKLTQDSFGIGNSYGDRYCAFSGTLIGNGKTLSTDGTMTVGFEGIRFNPLTGGIFGTISQSYISGGTYKTKIVVDEPNVEILEIGGLAGFIYESSVENLTVETDITVNSETMEELAGGLAGKLNISSFISGVTVKKFKFSSKGTESSRTVGGMLGAMGEGEVIDSKVEVVDIENPSVNGTTGGFVGFVAPGSTIANCTVDSGQITINSGSKGGEFCGLNEEGALENNISACKVNKK